MFAKMNFYKKTILLLIAVTCIFSCFIHKAAGQEKLPAKEDGYIYPNPNDLDDLSLYGIIGVNCEATRAGMEVVVKEANRKKNSFFIIIIRLENGERTSLYQARRKALTDWFEKRYTGKTVFALGAPVKEIGRADMYIGGKLATGLGFRRNNGKFCSDYK